MNHERDPKRWSESDAELPEALREALHAARADLGTSEEEAAEVAELARRLTAVLGPVAGLGGGDPGASDPGASGPGASDPGDGSEAAAPDAAPPGDAGVLDPGRVASPGRLSSLGGTASIGRFAPWALAGAGVVIGAGLAVRLFLEAPADSGVRVASSHDVASGAAPLPSDVPPSSPASASPEPDAAPAAANEVSMPPAPRAGRGATRQPPLGEAALLERAQSALRADPTRALSLTREHARRFRSGVLAEEREVIAIEALQRLGRHTAAAARLAAFERRYPESVHRARLQRGANTSAPPAGGLNTAP